MSAVASRFECRAARLLIGAIVLLCLRCFGDQGGEVLVIGYTNGAPVTKVSTNDYYRDKLYRGLEKQTPDVQLEIPKKWQSSYQQFSDLIVKEARKAGMDAGSLDQILKQLTRAEENKGLAFVPVAVHQTQDRGEPMWIITLKWEEKKAVVTGSTMAHIRFFWFNRKTLKQLGFVTCG